MKQIRQQGMTNQDKYLAGVAKALSHPARLAILRFLARKGSCMCGRIAKHLPVAQSTTSQHLRILKQAGLIQGKIEGTSVCYCLDPKGLAKASGQFGKQFDFLNEAASDVTCCDPS